MDEILPPKSSYHWHQNILKLFSDTKQFVIQNKIKAARDHQISLLI
jgi:hypothetical protein